jgi:hypothetical protein
VTPARRIEGGDRFSHQTVAVLEAFATSVIGLHDAIHVAAWFPHVTDEAVEWWHRRAAEWARGAVRCARLLTVKER